MGASFRSIDQVLGLAGCDLLTIAPSLLSQLEEDDREIQTALSIEQAKQAELIERPAQTPESFASELDKDLMAYQLLLGGIDGFISARHQLSIQLRQMFGMDAEIKLKSCFSAFLLTAFGYNNLKRFLLQSIARVWYC